MSQLSSKVSLISCFVWIVLLLIVVNSNVLGCSYFSNPAPPDEFTTSRTRTVFLGTLSQKTTGEKKIKGIRYKIHSLLFRVDQGLKGVQGNNHIIEYWQRLTKRDSCYVDPPDPKVGQQWVVYEGYDEGSNLRLHVRYPLLLSWQFNPEDASSRLRLSRIKEAIFAPRSAFFGQVEMALYEVPPPTDRGIEVELRSSDSKKVLHKGKVVKGRFSFLDLEPGSYVVRLLSPKPERLFEPLQITMKQDPESTQYFADLEIVITTNRPEFASFALEDK